MVFGPKKDTADKERIIGFHTSKEVHIQLKLISVLEEVFMTTILTQLTVEYLKTQPSSKEIIKLLAERAHKEWDKLCTINSKKRGWKSGQQLSKKWELFVDKAKSNLKLRKVNKDIIEMIISELELLELDR